MTDAATPSGGADEEGNAQDGDAEDIEQLRREVDRKYDFDDFGPADMAEMTAQEWDAAFEPDSWVTGDALLERVAADVKSRIARREIFGVVEWVHEDGEPRFVVYSDEGYAVVHPSGQVRGQGTVLRDVEPTVALCSMESYDPPEPPADWSLPDPEDVPEGSGEFGNLMMQIVAVAQLIAGIVLIGAWLLTGLETLVAPTMGVLFLLAGLFLLATVANARLSDRFRAAEYRDRLRAVKAAGEDPDFPPFEPEDPDGNDP